MAAWGRKTAWGWAEIINDPAAHRGMRLHSHKYGYTTEAHARQGLQEYVDGLASSSPAHSQAAQLLRAAPTPLRTPVQVDASMWFPYQRHRNRLIAFLHLDDTGPPGIRTGAKPWPWIAVLAPAILGLIFGIGAILTAQGGVREVLVFGNEIVEPTDRCRYVPTGYEAPCSEFGDKENRYVPTDIAGVAIGCAYIVGGLGLSGFLVKRRKV